MVIIEAENEIVNLDGNSVEIMYSDEGRIISVDFVSVIEGHGKGETLKQALEVFVGQIDSEIAHLKEMRDYLVANHIAKKGD